MMSRKKVANGTQLRITIQYGTTLGEQALVTEMYAATWSVGVIYEFLKYLRGISANSTGVNHAVSMVGEAERG
ncbi:unnamed protein product [Peronospora belbahrii]|uniref:Uncharacterized protein n=1 Tax=Peronospora belbahrii TaxID=622444 RepID=A0ABN8D148_9STRA|nr:unnamed protein product [Peronospora belbahrii]